MTDMTYSQLGASGFTVSTVGLGCNAFGSRVDAEQTTAVVRAALDVGITLLDTSDTYGRSGGTERFISAQNKYSLYDRSVEDELVPACEHIGVGLLPFFPLEYGPLTGKYKRDQPASSGTRLAQQTRRLETADFDFIETIERFAAERGLSLLQVVIGGLAAQPAVESVIAGATRPEQVAANAAAGSWQPTDEDLGVLNALSRREG